MWPFLAFLSFNYFLSLCIFSRLLKHVSCAFQFITQLLFDLHWKLRASCSLHTPLTHAYPYQQTHTHTQARALASVRFCVQIHPLLIFALQWQCRHNRFRFRLHIRQSDNNGVCTCSLPLHLQNSVVHMCVCVEVYCHSTINGHAANRFIRIRYTKVLTVQFTLNAFIYMAVCLLLVFIMCVLYVHVYAFC